MKNNMTGWRDVFVFTLTQSIKSKAYIGMLIFMLVLALASAPLLGMLGGGTTTEEGAADAEKLDAVSKVYCVWNSALPQLSFAPVKEQEGLSHITFTYTDAPMETLPEGETDAVLLTVTDEPEGYVSLVFAVGEEEPATDAISLLTQTVQECFSEHLLTLAALTETQRAQIEAEVTTEVLFADETGGIRTEEDTSISDQQYWVIYGILFVVMMIITMSGSQIASSIVSDKSSRVLEYVLTSIRPLALIVGKVLAMLVAVILQLVALLVGVLLSSKLYSILFGGSGESIFAQYLTPELVANLNPLNILICLVMVGLGLVFYATLAGIAGATVSRMEEASQSLTMFTLLVIVGAYVGIGAAGSLMGVGENTFVTFALIFPLSSSMLLPGAILIGKASLLTACLGAVVLVLMIVLLFRFAARIFETLILHNGNRIRLKELFAIFKNGAVGGAK